MRYEAYVDAKLLNVFSQLVVAMQSAAPIWADALGKAPVDGDERSDVAFATEECE